MQMTTIGSKSKPEVEFQYSSRLFQKPEVVIYQPGFDISKFGDFGYHLDYDRFSTVARIHAGNRLATPGPLC